MSNVLLVGTHWGDEGKGKIVDVLSEKASGCVRFQGGHNAGHTLVINGVKTMRTSCNYFLNLISIKHLNVGGCLHLE